MSLVELITINSNEKEAIKVLESIDEEYRDAVWYYRCAYAYGALVLDNSDGYTTNTMQQMLRLVDKGVRLATEAKLDDIKSYCFEVIDMCYLKWILKHVKLTILIYVQLIMNT